LLEREGKGEPEGGGEDSGRGAFFRKSPLQKLRKRGKKNNSMRGHLKTQAVPETLSNLGRDAKKTLTKGSNYLGGD